jgi:hypothetical protein
MKHCLGEILILVLLIFNDELVFNIIQIIFIIIPLNPWTPYTNFSNNEKSTPRQQYCYSFAIKDKIEENDILPLRRLYLVLH